LEEKRKDDLMAGVMADDPTSKKNEKWYFIEDPADMEMATQKEARLRTIENREAYGVV